MFFLGCSIWLFQVVIDLEHVHDLPFRWTADIVVFNCGPLTCLFKLNRTSLTSISALFKQTNGVREPTSWLCSASKWHGGWGARAKVLCFNGANVEIGNSYFKSGLVFEACWNWDKIIPFTIWIKIAIRKIVIFFFGKIVHPLFAYIRTIPQRFCWHRLHSTEFFVFWLF